MSLALLAYAPHAALATGLALFTIYLRWAAKSAGLHRRPILLAAAILGVLPALYVALAWARIVGDKYLRFERPTLALPVALVVVFVAHRLTALSPRQSPTRRSLTEGLMCLAALFAALATLGPEVGKPLDRLAVIVAIDRSRSIELVTDADLRVKAELQLAEVGMREKDTIGTVAFAATASVEDPLRPRTRLPAPQKVEVGRDATDVGAAIRRALAEVPSDAAARIVLITDGVSTRGDPIEAAAAAVAADVPIDVVPLDQKKVADVRVVALRMPSRAAEGEALDLRIVTSSSSGSELEVRLYRDGELVRRGNAKVDAGEDVLILREQAPTPGLHRYDVRVSALDPEHDEAPEDNEGSAFVRVKGAAAALILARRTELAVPMKRALEASAFRADIVGTSAVPADVAGLAAYDVVILSGIPAHDLSPTQLDALATYTRDLGGGLLLMGDEHSLGPGGYAKTPVEEVSPVSFDLKQERRRASLAEIIAIDYSGSMGARVGSKTKLELANEAAIRSAEILGAGDRLGVMHVDTVVQWTVPLAPVVDKKAIASKIAAVGVGGGGILVDITLEAGFAALFKEKVNLKHLLLFADGSDAEDRVRANALISDAYARGVTTSVVSLGNGPDVPGLESMSRVGKGRFYLIEDASRLPAVFAQETILASKSAINETTFVPKLSTRAPPTRGIDFDAAPPLTGYVVTLPKGLSQVLLRGPESDPILATWSVGIGRAAVFTSDFEDRWGAEWTSWGGAARMFGQLARDIARQADDPRVRLEADAGAGELHVRATVVDDDGRTESFRRLIVRVAGPDGFKRDVALEAAGAGAYGASVTLDRPGAYIATAIDELSGEPVGTTGAALTSGDELRPTGTDRALLARIASMTRGKERDTLAGIFDDRVAERFAYQGFTPELLLLGAFALLFGVGARRLALPEAVALLPARIATRRRRRREAQRARDASRVPDATTTMGALLGRKERGGTRPDPDAPPPSVPRFSRPPPIAIAPLRAPDAHAPKVAAPSARTSTAPAPPPPSQRQLSAAEILLARRRGRKR